LMRTGLRSARPFDQVERCSSRRPTSTLAAAIHRRTARRPFMKLALYLPNFRDEVTVKELEDLTALAEDLDFDSGWTLGRIVVPEASDPGDLHYPFGMMTAFPPGMPVISRGKWFQGITLIPWLAAKPQ